MYQKAIWIQLFSPREVPGLAGSPPQKFRGRGGGGSAAAAGTLSYPAPKWQAGIGCGGLAMPTNSGMLVSAVFRSRAAHARSSGEAFFLRAPQGINYEPLTARSRA